MRSILVLFETQSWQISFSKDSSDDHDGMLDLDDFAKVRAAKGMCVALLQDEVEDVSYAKKYIPVGSENYRKIWYKLHTSSSRWPNILMLCELLFSLPISTSHVEQHFSLLKAIKTKRWTSINNSTLHDLLEINVEGPPLTSFNAMQQFSCGGQTVAPAEE